MVGRCKEMMAREVQEYFRGKEMYEIKPNIQNGTITLKNFHSPLNYKISRIWRLDEWGQPIDPLNMIEYLKNQSLEWLGNFTEVNAGRFAVVFGSYDGEDGLEITDPDVATHVAVSCYYGISDSLDMGIEEERHPELTIERRYCYQIQREDRKNYKNPYTECKTYIITIPDTFDAAEYCLRQTKALKESNLRRALELEQYRSKIKDVLPAFERFKEIIELAKPSLNYVILNEEYQVRLMFKPDDTICVGVYMYTPEELMRLIADVEHALKGGGLYGI